MRIDYRALNANTTLDAYPIPCIDTISNYLGGSVIFTKIDLAQGYHQVRRAKDHKHRSAFQMHFGVFEYCVLLHRLYNAPKTI